MPWARGKGIRVRQIMIAADGGLEIELPLMFGPRAKNQMLVKAGQYQTNLRGELDGATGGLSVVWARRLVHPDRNVMSVDIAAGLTPSWRRIEAEKRRGLVYTGGKRARRGEKLEAAGAAQKMTVNGRQGVVVADGSSISLEAERSDGPRIPFDPPPARAGGRAVRGQLA